MNPVVTALVSALGDKTAAGKAAVQALAAAPTPLADVLRPRWNPPDPTRGRLYDPGMGRGATGSGGYDPGFAGGSNVQRIVEAARRAGFTGQGLATAVAVAMAESGGRENARGVNSDARRTVDRGPWQINSYWHREVPDAEAYNYDAAARHAFRISGGGRNWSPWTTYKTGAYRRYL